MPNLGSRSSHGHRRSTCILALCLALGVTQLTTCQDGGNIEGSRPAAQVSGGGGPADGSAPAAMPTELRRAFVAARMAEAGQEHAFSACGDGAGAFAASSPEQSLAFELDHSGLTVMPASGGPGAWRAEVRLVSVGRPERLSAVADATPEIEGNLVTYRRGPVEEWYRSSPAGLEQGFEVRQRPEGAGPLVLEVAIGGGMRPQLDERSGGAVLREGKEGRLYYSDLFAKDAGGRPLDARMAVEGQSVLLRIDDGCGGSCGDCGPGYQCSSAGQCVQLPEDETPEPVPGAAGDPPGEMSEEIQRAAAAAQPPEIRIVETGSRLLKTFFERSS
jgi:hypothetical protein